MITTIDQLGRKSAAYRGMKRCARCGATKGLGEFARNTRRVDGRESRCRPCGRAAAAEWRAANADSKRANNAAWRAANPGYAAAWRAANPDRVRAYDARRRARQRAARAAVSA